MFCSFDYKFFCFSSKEHQWISSFAGSGSGSEPGYFQTKVLFPNVFNNFCCLSMEEKIANRFGAKQIFSRSGSRTVLISPIRTLIWSKKVCNCAFLGLFYTLSMSTHSVSWHWQFLPLTPCPILHYCSEPESWRSTKLGVFLRNLEPLIKLQIRVIILHLKVSLQRTSFTILLLGRLQVLNGNPKFFEQFKNLCAVI